MQAMTDSLTEEELALVQNIIIDQLHIQPAQLKPEAALIADLGADSLDIVEIAMKLEEQFTVVVSDESMEKVQTMEDLCEALARALGRSRAE